MRLKFAETSLKSASKALLPASHGHDVSVTTQMERSMLTDQPVDNCAESHAESHDRGLLFDIETINRRMMGRRRTLAFLASAGTASLVAACGGEGSSSGGNSSSSATATPTPTPTATPTPTPSITATTGSCVVDSTETNGPYPADGTNTSSGSTSNVLNVAGISRSDIRSSFISSTTSTPGVELQLTLTLVDVNSGCAPIEGAAIYIWHCNAAGLYSLYSSGATAQSWLRGVQVTDANGQVTFTTVFPGCYSGRWPHIHFEVFKGGLTSSSTGRISTLISQLAMPAANCAEIYNGDSNYSSSINNYKNMTLATDNIFSDNTAAQMAQQTPTLTGSAAAGYTGTCLVGIAV